jgi:hypothetical protein
MTKPRLETVIRAAERAGKTVRRALVREDGIEIFFEEPPEKEENPFDRLDFSREKA